MGIFMNQSARDRGGVYKRFPWMVPGASQIFLAKDKLEYSGAIIARTT